MTAKEILEKIRSSKSVWLSHKNWMKFQVNMRAEGFIVHGLNVCGTPKGKRITMLPNFEVSEFASRKAG